MKLPINQVRVWVLPYSPLLQTTLWVLVGHRALDIELVAGHEASLLPAANDQALQAQQSAIIPFIPKPTKMARCRAAFLIPPKARELALRKRTIPRQVRAGSRPQATSRRHPMVKISRSAFTPRTPSPVLALWRAPGHRPRVQLQGESPDSMAKQHKDSPKKDSSRSSSSEEELPTNKALQDGARQKVWLLDTCFDAWCHDKIANNVAGWATQDTMICDLPEHGKAQPNHPDPMGPLLNYMVECKVFDCIWSDLYDLCRFYALGMTGNRPDFPAPRGPVTCSQVRDLLKSAQSIGHPYAILAHSADSVTSVSML